ncbi:carbohydrate binding [Branchiostoma belcheri]|nr:carbohydrate binding [Branchiostoma belcheri]
MEIKEYQCKKCRVHGVDAPLKGHKGICPWQHCACNDSRNGRKREGSPKEMTACDVIAIANMTRKDSGTTSSEAKSAQKQQARGVRNTKMYEALNSTPSTPHAQGNQGLFLRTGNIQRRGEVEKRLHAQGIFFQPARLRLPLSTSRDGASPMASTSRNDRPSTSRDDGACPSTSSVPDFALQDDVMTLTELFPGAQENLGLSALMDIRAGASNMETAVENLIGTWRHTGHPQISIFAMYRYRYRLDELMTENFKHHMYVPEKDGGNFIRRREDHCHLLKRIAMHLRKEPPRWFNHHALENALRPQDGEPTPGLTEASLWAA